jgi:hypothetical protein
MAKNPLLITLIVAVVVGAAAFFGGMQYQKTQQSAGRFGAANMQIPVGARRPGGQTGANAVRGEIISASDSNVTVKLADGSSKIVILSGNTTVSEATTAAKSALQSGKQVIIFGTTNTDGSITAQNIQLGTLGTMGRPTN